MDESTTTIDEVAAGIHRISTFVPDVSPEGFTFNQFLVEADEPLLYHTGPRGMFPLVAEAVERVLPVDRLRWISFSHVEADECGAMNLWLTAAPDAQVVHGGLAVDVSLNDLCDRPPVALDDGGVLDLGGKRVRLLATPHVPHGWEAIALFEETTRTLFSGDLLSQIGRGPAVVTEDLVPRALAMEEIFHSMAMAPNTDEVLHRLADLEPETLAIMHGPSYRGDGGATLRRFADALATAPASTPAPV